MTSKRFHCVDQTEDGPGGNCLMACVASIFGTSVESLPRRADYADDMRGMYALLCDAIRPFGYVPVCWNVRPPEWPDIAPPGYHIAIGRRAGEAPDSRVFHAVVALDGNIIHDPHPNRSGLGGPVLFWYLLMPAR
jgi:hypothetical protein